MKALLIIDVQNDFLPGGPLAVNDGNLVIPIINELQSQYELIVATQDWHPIDHESFVTQHPDKKVFDTITLGELPQMLWPEHCVQGSWGADFPAKLDTKKIAAIFRKGMNRSIDSYSGFYDNAKLSNTGLDGYLRSKNVSAVDICGLAGDYCVYFTAMDALALGFQTTILEHAIKSIEPKDFDEKKAFFVRQGGTIK